MRVLWIVGVISCFLFCAGCSGSEKQAPAEEKPVENEVFVQDFESGDIESTDQEQEAEEPAEGGETMDFEDGVVEEPTE